MSVVLTPGAATLDQLRNIWSDGHSVKLDPDSHPGIEAAARLVARAADGADPVYGINTGFGKLASVKIAREDTGVLQRNLILRRSAGYLDDALDDGSQTAFARSRRIGCGDEHDQID